jgi:hypothetical protein
MHMVNGYFGLKVDEIIYTISKLICVTNLPSISTTRCSLYSCSTSDISNCTIGHCDVVRQPQTAQYHTAKDQRLDGHGGHSVSTARDQRLDGYETCWGTWLVALVKYYSCSLGK